MRRTHEAKVNGAPNVVIWGTGKPYREFLHVDDLADALVHLLKYFSSDVPINIGTGEEVTIAELAHTVADAVGYHGELTFDASKPDGAPRKLLDARRMKALDWTSAIKLEDGLASTYVWFLENVVARA